MRTTKRSSGQNIYRHFDSIRQLNDYLCKGTLQPSFSPDSHTHGESFTGTKSYEEAQGLMLSGDSELQKKIEDAGVAQTRIKVQKQVARRQTYSSVVGAVPNVPAYISGAPNSMVSQKYVKVRQKVLNIGYGLTANGSIDKADIIEASAKVISALMQIEATGVRLSLFTLFNATKNGHNIGYSLKVKDASRKFDTLRMAYPMAHSSFLRRQCFRFEEVTEGVPDCFAYGYGAVPSGEAQAEFFKSNGLKLDAYLTFEQVRYLTVADIVKKIQDGAK